MELQHCRENYLKFHDVGIHRRFPFTVNMKIARGTLHHPPTSNAIGEMR